MSTTPTISATRRQFVQSAGLGVGTTALMPLRSVFAQVGVPHLVAVSNGGDSVANVPATISLIDPDRLEVALTMEAPGGSFAFPATRWNYARDVLWGGQRNRIAGFSLETGEEVAALETGSRQNYTELTPGGDLLVAARFTDKILKVDTAPDTPGLARVIGEFQHYEGAQPCDVTLLADGSYCFTPDRTGGTVSVFRVDPFEHVTSLQLEQLGDDPLEPYMATVSPRGDYLFVENARGDGSESIIDVSEPERPVEVRRLTQDDGLSVTPLTNEFTPDGAYCVIICRERSELTVVDTASLAVHATVSLPEGSNPIAGTFTPEGNRMFVPLPGRDAVAVVSAPDFGVETLIPVGARPLGAAYVENQIPQREGMLTPLGLHLNEPRQWPENCPDRCCGAV